MRGAALRIRIVEFVSGVLLLWSASILASTARKPMVGLGLRVRRSWGVISVRFLYFFGDLLV